MISPEYEAWRKEATGVLWLQKPLKFFKGPVSISMQFATTKALSDVDGRVKPCLDFLVRHEIIEEDHHKIVRRIEASWNNTMHGCSITIASCA